MQGLQIKINKCKLSSLESSVYGYKVKSIFSKWNNGYSVVC